VWGPALRIAILASILAAVALWLADTLLIAGAENAFFVLAALALASLYMSLSDRTCFRGFIQWRGLIWLTAISLGAGVFRLGMYQFGGWDEGLVVHIATYYAQGFKPYFDFPCNMPPLFMAGIRSSVWLFGFKWSSVILLTAIFASLTFLWMFSLLRIISVPRHSALFIALCAEMSTMLVIPFWWFNNSSSVSVVLLFLSALACLQQSLRIFPWVSLSLSLGMVVTCKPNDLPICLAVFALLIVKGSLHRTRAVCACAGAVAVFLLVCIEAQMPPTELIRSYLEIGRLRGSPFLFLPFRQMTSLERSTHVWFILLIVVCFAALLGLTARRRPFPGRLLFICIVAALTSLEMTCTNSEIKTSDLAVLLVAIAILCLRPWETEAVSLGRKSVLMAMLSLFMVVSGYLSVTSSRIQAIGPGAYYQVGPTNIIEGGFLSGLKTGPHLQRVISDTAQVLSRWPSERVFFGPRVEFEYAVFNKPVTKGMPLLWDPGNLFSGERLPMLIRTFQQDDPELLIFLKDDYTRMQIMGSYIRNSDNYKRIDTYGALTVYVRKTT